MELEALLNGGYAQCKALIARNRRALDALCEALLENEELSGAAVREIVEGSASEGDLAARRAGMEVAFL